MDKMWTEYEDEKDFQGLAGEWTRYCAVWCTVA